MMNDKVIEQFLNDVSSYVICSTLNQVVNFIPLPYIGENKIIDIYNLTYESTTQQDDGNSNADWDKNFEAVLKDVYSEKFCLKSSEDSKVPQDFTYQSYKDMIECVYKNTNEKGKTLWNITGGQRSFLLTIVTFLMSLKQAKNHWIVYVEGNKNQLIFGSYINNKWDLACLDHCKKEVNLNLGKYFRLAGFGLLNEGEDKKLDDMQDTLYKFTMKYIASAKLQESLLETNVGGTKDKDKTNKDKNIRMEKFKEIKDLDDTIKDLVGKQSYPFGYLLEYMAYSILNHEIKDKVVSIKHNVKIKNLNGDNTSYCELDIVVLTKTGKLIIFECKSGYMCGDNAKAREFTTYALGGVYGLPILITPMIPYGGKCGENVHGAIKSAQRAHMKFKNIGQLQDFCKEIESEL